LPENEDAWELWLNVLTQWRTGTKGVIGLDYNAAALISKTLEIPFDKVVFRKLRLLEMRVLIPAIKKQKGSSRDNPQQDFCRACRAAKKNLDCSTCNVNEIKRR